MDIFCRFDAKIENFAGIDVLSIVFLISNQLDLTMVDV